MNATAIDICSNALIKIGAEAIEDFDDQSAESEVARRLYPTVLDGLLVAHPWAFSLAQAPLVPDTLVPPVDFAYAFVLPADILRTVSAGFGNQSRGIIYRILGNRLLTDSPAVTLTYQRRPDEATFPPHFRQALIARLAAEFCIPLTEGTSRTESLFRLAAAELRVAKLADSQQSTPAAVEDFTLISVRGS